MVAAFEGKSPWRHHACSTEDETAGASAWSSLMARTQAGDQGAYQRLLEEITPYLRSLCRRFMGHDEEVEDVVQDILLTLHSIRHTYRPARPFKPWLVTIARRRIVDWIRQHSRRLHREDHSANGAANAGDPVGRLEDQTGEQPDDAFMREHLARQIHRAVAALPPHQREAITLVRLPGLTLEEAAEATLKSTGALKIACHRALKSLHMAFNAGGRRG